MKKNFSFIILIFLLSLIGCGGKETVKLSPDEIVKNLQYNNFTFQIYYFDSLHPGFYGLDGKRHKNQGVFEPEYVCNFIDIDSLSYNSEENPDFFVPISINAVNPYNSTTLLFFKNGFNYRKDYFDYCYTNEIEEISYTDDSGSCHLYIQPDGTKESNCNKQQLSSIETELNQIKSELKAWNVSKLELLTVYKYIVDNYAVSIANDVNKNYQETSDVYGLVNLDPTGKRSLKEDSLHIFVDDSNITIHDNNVDNAFIYLFDESKNSYNYTYCHLNDNYEFLVSNDFGTTYKWFNSKNGCEATFPFYNAGNFFNGSTDNYFNANCTESDRTRAIEVLQAKNNFLKKLKHNTEHGLFEIAKSQISSLK